MKALRRLLERFEDEMTAAAFAEAGEVEAAREILRGTREAEGVSGGGAVFDDKEVLGLNILANQAESK
ncbi:MAG: hypothetical protein GXO94_03385 [Nitrospirae bacterium]|nr:hypothetical protein [Nitrospirota bacterium]